MWARKEKRRCSALLDGRSGVDAALVHELVSRTNSLLCVLGQWRTSGGRETILDSKFPRGSLPFSKLHISWRNRNQNRRFFTT